MLTRRYPQVQMVPGPEQDWTENLQLRQPLRTIAKTSRPLIYDLADDLQATNLSLPNLGTILGVEVVLAVDRFARVQDEIIQWELAGQLIGQNKAPEQDTVSDLQVYGSPEDLWGIDWTAIDYRDPGFGLRVRLVPHTQYPCSVTPYYRSLELRFYHE